MFSQSDVYICIHRCIVRLRNNKKSKLMQKINDIAFSDDLRILIKCHSDKKGSIIIPEGVMGIRGEAFFGCSIESITLPSTIQRIGNKAFAHCENLKSIELPEGLQYLGEKAFEHCASLSSVIVPSSLEELQNGVFAYCWALKKVTISDPGLKSIGYRCFYNCWSMEEIVIPSSVTAMGIAFRDCWELKKVVIKSKKIQGNEDIIFKGCCPNLIIEKAPDFKWIRKKRGLKVIKKKKFAKTDGELKLWLPEHIVRIDEFAFYKNIGLIEISIPCTVKKISPFAFAGCTSLSILTIKEGVEKIEKFAFHGCINLTSVVLPSSIKEIGMAAFAGCTSLKRVTLSKRTQIEENAFLGTSKELSIIFRR